MAWTIQQVSLKTGIPTDSLRYYDKLGIVSPRRNENGYRCYSERDMADLQTVSVMKYAQFTLAEIRAIVELSGNAPTPECNEVGRAILTAKTAELRRAVANYSRIIELLEAFLPLVDGIEAYTCNQERIGAFVRQIHEDIQRSGSPKAGSGGVCVRVRKV